jgi:hypothetical protein
MDNSACIFSGSINYEGNNLPKEVYFASFRVMKTGITEIVKDNSGFYIIEYSESGPFSNCTFGTDDEWIKIRIYRIDNWKSGGIKKTELESFFNGS